MIRVKGCMSSFWLPVFIILKMAILFGKPIYFLPICVIVIKCFLNKTSSNMANSLGNKYSFPHQDETPRRNEENGTNGKKGNASSTCRCEAASPAIAISVIQRNTTKEEVATSFELLRARRRRRVKPAPARCFALQSATATYLSVHKEYSY